MGLQDKLFEVAGHGMQTGRAKLTSLGYGIAGIRSAPMDTAGDMTAREQQGFPDVESKLPTHIGGHSEGSILDRVFSFALGDKNPLAKEAFADSEIVWLLDNTAYRPNGDDNTDWETEFVAAYFARHTGNDLKKAVASIADTIGVDGELGDSDQEAVQKKIEQRLRPFSTNISPAKYVNVAWAGRETRQLGPGGINGISSQILGDLGNHKGGDVVLTSPVEDGLGPHAPCSTFFAEPEGWTVISDIDDSIKITLTSSPIGLLRSTFYDEPTPIKGMPELYQHINSRLSPNWFYLSASPYNLYSFLREFLRAHYPPGTTILRDASWQNLDGLLQSLTVGTEAYKVSRIDKILKWLPNRKVICVGDSTQSDPEVYGDMYRKKPSWIKLIMIRKVTGVKGMDETKKNEPERFEKAFEGVPRSIWRLFDDPSELYQAVDALQTV